MHFISKHIVAIVFLLSFSCMLYAQAPPVLWQKCIGGSKADEATFITNTPDGGYVLAGSAASNDGNFIENRGKIDYAIVKVDSLGNVLWRRSYGGGNNDIATAVLPVKTGGYIVVGYSGSYDGDVLVHHGDNSEATDYWILKITEGGIIEWQKSYGGTDYDYAYSVACTPDGGYIVTGMSSSHDGDVIGDHGYGDCWVIKLNSVGALEWQRSFGGTYPDVGMKIKVTLDGGYVVAGFTFSDNGDLLRNNRSGNMWMFKLDKVGNIEWQRTIGGTYTDYAEDIELTNDGGYIVTGNVDSKDEEIVGNHGRTDCIVVKLNKQGQVEWQKCYGGSEGDYGQSIQQTPDGGYVVAGYSYSNDGDVSGNHGNNDAWVFKVNSVGEMQWQQSYGGTKSDQLLSVLYCKDGGYMLAGFTSSNDGHVSGNHSDMDDIWVVKLGCISLVPSIKIKVDNSTVCSGYTASFTAIIKEGGGSPIYQWQKNGLPVGSNNSVYITTDLKDNDQVFCYLTSNEPCAIVKKVSSDTIKMHVIATDPALQPTISITASDSIICERSSTSFEASAINAGTAPVYQWRINNVVAPEQGPRFSTTSLQNNDIVQANLLVANNPCANTIASNSIGITVKKAPIVNCMPDTIITAGNAIRLNAGISGNIVSYHWTASPGSFASSELRPVVTPMETNAYNLEVESQEGCKASDAVSIKVIETVKIPNAFSPNGDGINDEWIIRGLDAATFEIRIFDRYGNTIAELNGGRKNWDGTIKGKPVPSGTYYYLISQQNAKAITGSVTIIR